MNEINLKNKSVLILEDSLTQALLLQEILEKKQLFVRLSKDGLHGLQKLSEAVPDLIISDIEMPQMNGYEFCKNVKSNEKYKDIPIILLTNLTDPLDVIKGMDCGADGFLTKPCDVDLLFSTIQNTLKNIGLKNNYPQEKLTFFFGGESYSLTINKVQITELLLSTYSSAIQKNLELEKIYYKLNDVYEELERKNRKLEELNELKNQLLGMAAHDIKNPLAVIYGFSNYLINISETLDSAKSYQMIKHIYEASSFMIRVIDDLLDYSTIESGTLTLHLSEIDLAELIQKDLLFFESLAQKKEIKLVFNNERPIKKVCCDANKISQVLCNLITNGIKFSRPQGTLEISLIPSDKEVTISVKDCGTGMSPEALSSLFQPFSKMKTTGTAGEKGAGLGLAIVNKIVHAHKGKIWVESKLDVGSIFYISIPYTMNYDKPRNSDVKTVEDGG